MCTIFEITTIPNSGHVIIKPQVELVQYRAIAHPTPIISFIDINIHGLN